MNNCLLVNGLTSSSKMDTYCTGVMDEKNSQNTDTKFFEGIL